MTTDTFFRRRGNALNRAVLTLMVAGAALAYAAGTIAETVDDPWRTVMLSIGIACALGSLALFYARFVEPSWIVVTRTRVACGLPRGLRIAVIGDFHVGPFKREAFLRRVIRRTNALSPDVILLVGDFLFDHASDVSYLAPLESLRAPLGTFAVVGNHDSGAHGKHARDTVHDRADDVEKFLAPRGIQFLRNGWTVIGEGVREFCIAGVDDVWMHSHDIEAAFRARHAGMPTILLAHNPDVILDTASHRANLIVSGHTHGGQVRLPFFGPLTTLPIELNKKFDRGIFPITPTCTLAITHGIGETFLPLRFFARPEILLLTT